MIDNILDSLNTENSNNENNLYTTTLSQGVEFKKKQDTIVKNTEQKEKKLKQSLVEGFDNDISKTLKDSKALLSEGQMAQNKFSEFKQLQDQFNSTLETYKSFQAGLLTKTGNFIRKSDSPYLNKNIKYKNNDIDYVTGAGIMKKYPSMAVLNATAGKNGCPVANWTQLDSNTTPDGLILGTPIVQGQSCGNENANVRVNAVNNNATANYIGCYKDTSTRALPTVINGGNQQYSQASCATEAAKGGYKYFGLQDGVSGNSQCFVGNDLTQATKYGISTKLNSVALWSSNTANGQRNTATLTRSGSLVVKSPNGTVLYTSPNAPGDCIEEGQINSVVATYGGNCNGKPWYVDCGGGGGWNWWFNNRATYNIPYGNANNLIAPLVQANPVNFNYSAAQNFPGDPAYCCIKKFDYSYQCGNKTKSGRVEAGQNINFNCTAEHEKCVFYLTLQDDGNMCIYRGTGPSNNKGSIWCSMTNGKQQSPNTDWVASQGKTAQNYINSNVIINSDQWIGSTNGSLKLIMQTDGNLVLYTSNPVSNCIEGSDGKKYGGAWTNAVYELGEQGDPALVGKVGYVDEDAVLSEYPSTMIGPNGNIINSSSCSKTVTNIDSVQWKNYNKSGQQMSPSTICGLGKDINSDNARLAELRATLRSYSSQIIEHISYLESLNINISNQMGIDKSSLIAGLSTYKKYRDDFSQYNNGEMHNINGILADSDIVTSYENYSYILWSVLAITVLIITFTILKKRG